MKFIWNGLATACFIAFFGALVLRWLAQGGGVLPAPFSDPLPRRAGIQPDRRTLWKVFWTAILFRVAAALGSLCSLEAK